MGESPARLHLTVVPGTSREDVVAGADGSLRVRVAAPAKEGRANAALISLLAERLDVPRSHLNLVRGHGSRHKVVEIASLSVGEVLRRLGIS